MAQIPFVTTPHNSGLGDPLATAFEAQQSMNTELYDTAVFEVPGMGLSEANFTNADKDKLDSIVTPIAPQVQADAAETNPVSLSFINNKPENTSDFVNDGDGINPFVADIDSPGIYARVIGGWVLVNDLVFPKMYFVADGITKSFDTGVLIGVKAVFEEGALLDDNDWSQVGSIFTLTYIPEAGKRIKPI
jgi:hypothetical protein